MTLWQKTLLAARLGVVGMGVTSAIWLGFARWNSKTSERIEQLFQALSDNKRHAVHFEELEQLPVPTTAVLAMSLNSVSVMSNALRLHGISQ